VIRAIVTLIGALVLSAAAQAGDGITVGAHIASWHSEPGYNNTNLGAYLRTADGWTVGTYFNSQRKQSAYAGRTFSTQLADQVEASVTVGAITGYKLAPVLPLLVPSLRIGGDVGLRLAYLPPIEKQGTHVAHVSVEWSL
jgi:hypothetical protein